MKSKLMYAVTVPVLALTLASCGSEPEENSPTPQETSASSSVTPGPGVTAEPTAEPTAPPATQPPSEPVMLTAEGDDEQGAENIALLVNEFHTELMNPALIEEFMSLMEEKYGDDADDELSQYTDFLTTLDESSPPETDPVVQGEHVALIEEVYGHLLNRIDTSDLDEQEYYEIARNIVYANMLYSTIKEDPSLSNLSFDLQPEEVELSGEGSVAVYNIGDAYDIDTIPEDANYQQGETPDVTVEYVEGKWLFESEFLNSDSL